MNHITSEMLNQLFDDALSSQERSDVQAHLTLCMECSAELDALRRVSDALKALPPDPVSFDLTANVMWQIKPAHGSWWIETLLIAQIAAAGVLLVLLGESLAAWLDLLPDFGTIVLSFIQETAEALNAIRIEPLENIAPLEWILICSTVGIAWLVANSTLLALSQKEN